MKLDIIAFSLLFMTFIIGNVELSSSNIVINDRRDSYIACKRLKAKAPYFNLKCENLIEEVNNYRENFKEQNEINNTKIKTLSMDKSCTRKVDKIQEIKLKNLLKKLSVQNKLSIN